MHTTLFTTAALLSLGQLALAAAARNGTEVRDFLIYPQQLCKIQGQDMCDPNTYKNLPSYISNQDELIETLKNGMVSCGSSGNMCIAGICGRFAGKDNMCCGGKGAHMSLNIIVGLNNL